jgi:hypothetical protein
VLERAGSREPANRGLAHTVGARQIGLHSAVSEPLEVMAIADLDANLVDQGPETGSLPLANRAPNHVSRGETGKGYLRWRFLG